MGTDNLKAFSEGEGTISGLLNSGETIPLLPHWSSALRERDTRKESPSSVGVYIECPLKWFSQRHAPENEGGVFVPNTFSVIGNYSHRVLELFFDLYPEERTEEALADIDDSVWDALSSGKIRGGVVSQNMIKDFKYAVSHPFGYSTPAKTREFIRKRGSESADMIFDFGDPQDVDVVGQEEWTNVTSNGIRINGKIDRIDDIGNGETSLVDYKTGKYRTPEGVKPNFDDLEFFKSGMYAAMEGDKAVRIEQVYLSEPLARYRIGVTKERRDFINKVIDTVTSGMEAVEVSGTITYRPGDSKEEGVCKYCPIKDVCPAWEPENNLDHVAEFLREARNDG